MKVLAVIPARYNSTRFPGKALANIMGKSMIQRVVEQCKKCHQISKIIVATDDERISFHVKSFGAAVMMTSKDHNSGTERCGEVLKKIEEKYDVILNIQGDEPYINPSQISEVLNLFNDENVEIGTLAKKISSYNIYKNKNKPKVSFNSDQIATLFTRIGDLDEKEFEKKTYFHHIGIYGFKSETLSNLSNLENSKFDNKEDLEQLEWMHHDYKIKVGITDEESVSINHKQDIKNIESLDVKKS